MEQSPKLLKGQDWWTTVKRSLSPDRDYKIGCAAQLKSAYASLWQGGIHTTLELAPSISVLATFNIEIDTRDNAYAQEPCS